MRWFKKRPSFPVTSANVLEHQRAPRYGRSLPAVMGSGGWPVEEPTHEQIVHFLNVLHKIPHCLLAPNQDGSEYTCVIKVRQWLDLLVKARLLEGGQP